jgi:hypothetical protein
MTMFECVLFAYFDAFTVTYLNKNPTEQNTDFCLLGSSRILCPYVIFKVCVYRRIKSCVYQVMPYSLLC